MKKATKMIAFLPKFIGLCLILSLSAIARGESPAALSSPIPEVKTESNRYKLGILTGYNMTSNQGSNLNSIEFGAIGRLAINYKTSIFIEGAQGLLTDSFTAGFTSIGFGYEYHIWGENSVQEQQVRIKSYEVVNAKDYSSSLFSVSVMAKQYFFNGSSNVYPFTGLGLCSRYQFASENSWAPFASGCYDYLINPPNTSSAVRVYFGFDFFI